MTDRLQTYQNRFKFLEAIYGFQCIEAGAHDWAIILRYVNERVEVEINYDTEEVIPEVMLTCRSMDNRLAAGSFYLGEIMAYRYRDESYPLHFYAGQRMEEVAGIIADLLVTYAEQFLEGEETVFEELRRRVSQ